MRTMQPAEAEEARAAKFVLPSDSRIENPHPSITFAVHRASAKQSLKLPTPPEQPAQELQSPWPTPPMRTRSRRPPDDPPSKRRVPRTSPRPQPDPPGPASFAQ